MSEPRRRRQQIEIAQKETNQGQSSEQSAVILDANIQEVSVNYPNLMRCPDCWNVVSVNAYTCPHCGRPFQFFAEKQSSGVADTPNSSMQKKKKRKKKKLSPIWYLVLICLIAVIGFFGIREFQKHQLKSMLMSARWWNIENGEYLYLEFTDHQIEYSMSIGYTNIYPIHTYNYQVTSGDTIKVGNTEVRITDYDSFISFSPSFVANGISGWFR